MKLVIYNILMILFLCELGSIHGLKKVRREPSKLSDQNGDRPESKEGPSEPKRDPPKSEKDPPKSEGLEARLEKGCRGKTCKFIDSCGKAPLNKLTKSSKIASYMINGERQKYGDWPSYVRIQMNWSDNLFTLCGGTIITDQEILTAAHCMFDPWSSETQIQVKNIEVTLGEDVVHAKDKYEKSMQVESACISKRFTYFKDNPNAEKYQEARSGEEVLKENETVNTRYDFAVLKLTKKIRFTDYYQPACMPRSNYTKDTNASGLENCYLVGTGVVGWTKPAKKGQKKLPVMAKDVENMRMKMTTCKAFNFGYRDDSRECYTKAESNGDSCSGDSGGPILCLDPKTKRWTVVASVSYGASECNGPADYGWVGVYARLSNIYPIIRDECDV